MCQLRVYENDLILSHFYLDWEHKAYKKKNSNGKNRSYHNIIYFTLMHTLWQIPLANPLPIYRSEANSKESSEMMSKTPLESEKCCQQVAIEKSWKLSDYDTVQQQKRYVLWGPRPPGRSSPSWSWGFSSIIYQQ